jgi:2-keto-3-deoxy-L-rhamnonate aldolase RhmA
LLQNEACRRDIRLIMRASMPDLLHSDFEFALWTIDPALASAALSAGVRWIGPDLEIIGKHERQAGTGSLISAHSQESVPMMRELVGSERLFARCNGPGTHLKAEIESLLNNGVRCLMVPMLRRLDEAQHIVDQVAGRAQLVLMIEHADILDSVEEVAALPGVHTLYVGTNDLALSMGYQTRFGPVKDGWVDRIAAVAKARGLGFSFLGFGRLSAVLPVPVDLVIASYVHHGVGWGLFARSFAAAPQSFDNELDQVRQRLVWWRSQSTNALAEAHDRFMDCCAQAERNGLPHATQC